jgi:hypothetical protein
VAITKWRWRGPARDARDNEPADIAAHLLRRRGGAGNAGLIRHRSGVADCEVSGWPGTTVRQNGGSLPGLLAHT